MHASFPTPEPERKFEVTEPAPTPRNRLRRIMQWTGAILIAFTWLITILTVVVYNSASFHRYVLAKVQAEASDSLGVNVILQNFALHLSSLSLDLYGVTVAGANPYPNPPLLQVEHAEASVRIVSVLRGKWYLENIHIDHPVVQVYVDKNGVSNIPKPKSNNNSKSNTTVFDLGIRHAVLDRGEVIYNDQPSTLAVDLHDLDFHAAFDSAAQKYSGKLAYTGGQVVYGAFKPLQHDFEAQFDLTPTAFQLSQARVTAGASQINLAATVNNYNTTPIAQAQYDITIDGNQIAELMNSPSVPSGVIRATGTAQYQQVANRALLDTLVVSGDLNSRELIVNSQSIRAAIQNLAAHYTLQNGDATLRDFRASILGGEVTAQGAMRSLAGNPYSNFVANIHGVSLGELKRTLGPAANTPGVALTGGLDATATASWGKTLDNLVARADATINAKAAESKANQTANAIPVNSAIHAIYTGSNKQLAVNQSYLRTPQTALTINGVLSNRSSLALHLQANDLRELAAIANLFSTPSPATASGQTQRQLNLAGTASFQGNVQGSTTAPHLTGQLIASNLEVSGSSIKSLRAGIDLSHSQARLINADLVPVNKGHIALNASTGLTKWSFTKTSPIQVDLSATQMNIADLIKLSGQQIPVTGVLDAHVSLHGTELNPLGSGNVALTKVSAYDEPITSLQVTFSGTGDEAHADLSIQLPAGNVQSKLSVRPKDRTYTAQLTSSGIQLDKLQALKIRNIAATGTLALNANGQGSFDNPQLDATLNIPALLIQHQTVSGINLHMNLANHIANADLSSSAANTSIQAKAKVNLSGDYLADASLDTQSIPIQPLLAAYAPEQAASISGQTEVHATLHGPLKNKNLLEAHLTVPYLRLGYTNKIQLAATSPIHIDYKNGDINVQHSAIRGTDTDLEFQGTIPANPDAAMSLLLKGTVNLQLAQLFDPDVRTGGQLKFNINSNGKARDTNLGGEIDIVDASYADSDLPVGLQHGNGVLTLTTDRINIKNFQGTVGGGTVTAQGGVAYRPAMQFDLGLAAQGIRLLYPQGMRESIDANVRLAGTMEAATLGGTVNLADLSFTPAFDLTGFIGQFSGGVAAPPSQGFSNNIQLNLAVHSTNNVNLVSRTLSVNGAANLQVRGTAADPVILGRVDLNSGDIILNGDRFVLNGGTVQFVNPSETQPVVNVSIKTTIQQYDIDLRFNGPVDHLTTQYTSDPALPSADIINLLAFGQTTEASAVNSAGTTTTQTGESLIASQVSSQVTSRLSKVAGISQLSINPVLAGNSSQGPPGANITIQQRVTGNLFVTFSTNVASTQSQVIQGQYQVSPRVAVSATRDQNGGFAVDTLIKKSW